MYVYTEVVEKTLWFSSLRIVSDTKLDLICTLG